MRLAQGRFWEIRLDRDRDVSIVLLREAQSEALPELEVSVPLDRWNRVVKHVLTDRKLFPHLYGGGSMARTDETGQVLGMFQLPPDMFVFGFETGMLHFKVADGHNERTFMVDPVNGLKQPHGTSAGGETRYSSQDMNPLPELDDSTLTPPEEWELGYPYPNPFN